ncbi:MAG: xanthine dehydrogenase family protein molybdopterin-binding subunit, partial [Tagaea sp.]|nr:xanthine dehydrogenase family protein molybdopterin-binding subunit [Tagaea sp.]
LPRFEDDRLLRGAGRFVADLAPADALHVAFARAVQGPARLVRVEASRAVAMPGVRLVLTGADTQGLGRAAVNRLVENLDAGEWPILARDRVAAAGQAVALVVADTPAQALDAVEAIEIESEPLDVGPEAPCFSHASTRGDIDAAFTAAAKIVRVELAYPRVAPMALEPRAVLASQSRDLLTVQLSTQTPHRARADLAAILGIAECAIRVVAPDVGGAFGGKASLAPDEAAVAFAATRLDRPVLWVATRSEEFVAGPQGRALELKGELALAADGRFLGLRADIDSELGHWLTYSATVPARNAARILPGPYRIDAIALNFRGRRSARPAVGIYRGAGRPEAAMLMERLVDEAARALGVDPIGLRRINLVPAGAFRDAADFAGLLDAAERTMPSRRGPLHGVGVALYVEPCGQGAESVTLRHDGAGRFTLATGATAQGQGRETAYAQIAAEALGVTPDAVAVLHGDTAVTPTGVGALASRSTAIGGSAVLQAAERLIAEIGQGGWAKAPEGQVAVSYTAPDEAWASGAVVASVTIDAETGVPNVERLVWIDDAGTVVNPMLVEGQLRGGLAQGLGEALLESLVYDANGQLLSGSLMDYAVPRAGGIPAVELVSRPTRSRNNKLGAKGVGEAGCIGVPAAIANAILDALAPLGVARLDMPMTAAKIWQAIGQAEKTR